LDDGALRAILRREKIISAGGKTAIFVELRKILGIGDSFLDDNALKAYGVDYSIGLMTARIVRSVPWTN
jgi:hypothetical protein